MCTGAWSRLSELEVGSQGVAPQACGCSVRMGAEAVRSRSGGLALIAGLFNFVMLGGFFRLRRLGVTDGTGPALGL